MPAVAVGLDPNSKRGKRKIHNCNRPPSLLHSVLERTLEVVPVDLAASAILVVAALLLGGQHERVYQLGTADVNPILLESLVTVLDAESRKRRRNSPIDTKPRLSASSRASSTTSL